MVIQDNLKLMTVDAFEALIARPENAERRLELIDGEIAEKMPTQKHAATVGIFQGEIYIHLKTYPIGWGMVEARYRMPADDHNARLPDVSFVIGRDRPLTQKGSAPYMPDLAIEVKSPDDSFKAMRRKADYYLANGTRLVWLVHLEKRLVEVYRPDADVEILTEDGILSGEDVLPGFSLPLRTVFAVP